jgi:molecular chaperone IbpA
VMSGMPNRGSRNTRTGRPFKGGSQPSDLAFAGGFSMTTVDFAPLFRTAIGFDRLARLVDTAASGQEAQSYPPYNIEKVGDDQYRLTMAVAGFRPEDLDITVKDNTLFVSGRVANEGQRAEILYRGIAGRAFERRFVLADHIVVEGADVQNGLLHVGLKRVVPEALKPRKIAIGSSAPVSSAPTIANDSQDAVKAA